MKIIERIKTFRAHPLTPLWLCVFIDILGYSMLTPFLPQIMLGLNVPIALIGTILSIPPFFGFFTNILWGSLSDRIGRKKVILILRVGTLLSYLLLALATDLRLIIASRIVAGVFNSVVIVSLTVVNDVVSPEKRSLELSRVGAAWLVGSILGPFLGALVADSGAFGLGMINYLVIGVTIFVTWFYLKESHEDFKDGAAAQTGAEKKPIVSVGLLRKPLPRLLLIQNLFNRIPYFMFVMTSSLLVTIRFGFNVAQIGTFFTSISIVNLIIRTLLFPHTLRKLGDARTVRLGFALYLIAFGWLIFAGSVWEFALINMIMSFATSTAVDVMNGVMSHAVQRKEMGEMMGLASAVESLAMVLGPIVGSALLDSPSTRWYGMFGISLAAVPFLLEFSPLKRLPAIRAKEES